MPYDVNHVLEHAEVAGWVLGALEPAEAQAFEGHLRSCGQCQAAVAEFEPVAKALGRAAPAAEPPGDLQARTIARVQAAAAGDQDATQVHQIPRAAAPAAEPAADQALPGPGEPEPGGQSGGARVLRFPRRLGRGRLLTVVGAVAAAVIVALVILPGRGGGPPAGAFAFNLAPVGGQAGSGTATALQDSSGSWKITMTVRHLKNLGEVPFYECWWVGTAPSVRGQLVSAGTFVVGNDGTGTFPMTGAADPRQFRTIEITAQLSGSTTQPGRVVLRSTAPA